MKSDINPKYGIMPPPRRLSLVALIEKITAFFRKFSKSTVAIAVGCVALVAVFTLVGVIIYSTVFEKEVPSPPSQEAIAGPTTNAPTPVDPNCTNFKGSMTAPTQLQVEAMALESPMVVVGKDKDGNPGAPNPEDGFTTAWYNRSAAPGNEKGNVILTIHTYSQGDALGNELLDPKFGLEPGDVLKITDVDGNQVCYEYTHKKKIIAKDYDPASGVFHNLEGPPQLAIMVCDDWNKSSKQWDARVIFYARLV